MATGTLIGEEHLGGCRLQIYTGSIDAGAVTAESTAAVDLTLAGVVDTDKVAFCTPQGNPGARVCVSGCVTAAGKVTVTVSNSGDDNSADLDAFTVIVGVLKMS